jgi:hypothetical protein
VCAAATVPAWRAARRSPAQILRGGDLAGHGAASERASFAGLGVRFAVAHRARFAAAVATVGACAGVVALMLSLASLLEALRDDPGTLGRKYALQVQPDTALLDGIRATPGVADAGTRYAVEAADSFRLGQPVQVIAYQGDHTRFEAPPLAEGRRLRGPDEVEVGRRARRRPRACGRAARLALQLPSGDEARFRVRGDRAGARAGRAGRLRAAGPPRRVAPRRSSSASTRAPTGARRRATCARSAPSPSARGGAAARRHVPRHPRRGAARASRSPSGLVCLYGLVQAVAMTARERRGAVAVLRASGADARASAPAAGRARPRPWRCPQACSRCSPSAFLFGPLVERLAAGFADLRWR